MYTFIHYVELPTRDEKKKNDNFLFFMDVVFQVFSFRKCDYRYL